MSQSRRARRFLVVASDALTDRPAETAAIRSAIAPTLIAAVTLAALPSQLKAQDQWLPDFVILDATGNTSLALHVLRELKKDPRLRQIPVIMMYPAGSADLVREAYENRANACIRAPWEDAAAVEVVSQLVRFWAGIVLSPFLYRRSGSCNPTIDTRALCWSQLERDKRA